MAKKKYKQDEKICVKDDTKKALDALGSKGDTYNDIIQRLFDVCGIKKK